MAESFDYLEVSDSVEAKINGAHHVSVDDVLDALEDPIREDWHDHPERGTRLLVESQVRGRRLLIVLYPDPNSQKSWRLATAYFLDRS